MRSIDHPDFLIIDLDPDPKLPFNRVCQLALRVREVLQGLELRSFVKTSGSKGLHVLVPLKSEYHYSQVKGFGEIVARLSTHGMEEIATVERSLERRKGRIYVDYLQNGRGKTIVSPYCLRPRPGAPVSTPLDWSELRSGIRPAAFNIKTIFRRIEQKGDLWAEFGTDRQSLHGALEQLQHQLGGSSDES